MTSRRWVPPFAWAAIILVITSIPSPNLGVVAPFAFPGADKIVHAALYGVLGWLSARAALRDDVRLSAIGVTLMSITIFAAADEWHQEFVPGRAADALDWLTDSLAAATAILWYAWRKRVQPA